MSISDERFDDLIIFCITHFDKYYCFNKYNGLSMDVVLEKCKLIDRINLIKNEIYCGYNPCGGYNTYCDYTQKTMDEKSIMKFFEKNLNIELIDYVKSISNTCDLSLLLLIEITGKSKNICFLCMNALKDYIDINSNLENDLILESENISNDIFHLYNLEPLYVFLGTKKRYVIKLLISLIYFCRFTDNELQIGFRYKDKDSITNIFDNKLLKICLKIKSSRDLKNDANSLNKKLLKKQNKFNIPLLVLSLNSPEYY